MIEEPTLSSLVLPPACVDAAASWCPLVGGVSFFFSTLFCDLERHDRLKRSPKSLQRQWPWAGLSVRRRDLWLGAWSAKWQSLCGLSWALWVQQGTEHLIGLIRWPKCISPEVVCSGGSSLNLNVRVRWLGFPKAGFQGHFEAFPRRLLALGIAVDALLEHVCFVTHLRDGCGHIYCLE